MKTRKSRTWKTLYIPFFASSTVGNGINWKIAYITRQSETLPGVYRSPVWVKAFSRYKRTMCEIEHIGCALIKVHWKPTIKTSLSITGTKCTQNWHGKLQALSSGWCLITREETSLKMDSTLKSCTASIQPHIKRSVWANLLVGTILLS